ncbi:nicotinamide N-methyltransferase-like [Dysidea avara]|uniref:nicotinamide N-methyltransferase-like n=1 Tax=Dysidea avara TaxID=196820 RepID=UPI00332C9B83
MYNSKWDINTARLLEFGGGPSIAGLISAVPYVNEIIFSAHTEGERKEVEQWKFEKDGAHNWADHFKFVVNELENITGDTAWFDREKMLRQCITAIIGCDIVQDYPLSIKQDPFQIIYTSLCLEAACKTYTE